MDIKKRAEGVEALKTIYIAALEDLKTAVNEEIHKMASWDARKICADDTPHVFPKVTSLRYPSLSDICESLGSVTKRSSGVAIQLGLFVSESQEGVSIDATKDV
jgi:hypothetical protein